MYDKKISNPFAIISLSFSSENVSGSSGWAINTPQSSTAKRSCKLIPSIYSKVPSSYEAVKINNSSPESSKVMQNRGISFYQFPFIQFLKVILHVPA